MRRTGLEQPQRERAPGPAPLRRRERRDPEATRAALLRAAEALFAESGFDGTSVEQIAEAAGVNKAMINYHFGGKGGLYRAILEETFSEIAARVAAVEVASLPAPRVLGDLVRAVAGVAIRRPDFPRMFLRELLTKGIDPKMAPHLVRIVGVTHRTVSRGVAEGSLRRVDPMLVHFGLVGALVFYLATEPARRSAVRAGRVPFRMPTPGELAAYLEELTLRGLAPDPVAGAAKGASR